MCVIVDNLPFFQVSFGELWEELLVEKSGRKFEDQARLEFIILRQPTPRIPSPMFLGILGIVVPNTSGRQQTWEKAAIIETSYCFTVSDRQQSFISDHQDWQF